MKIAKHSCNFDMDWPNCKFKIKNILWNCKESKIGALIIIILGSSVAQVVNYLSYIPVVTFGVLALH